jgi:hypothetical protein
VGILKAGAEVGEDRNAGMLADGRSSVQLRSQRTRGGLRRGGTSPIVGHFDNLELRCAHWEMSLNDFTLLGTK